MQDVGALRADFAAPIKQHRSFASLRACYNYLRYSPTSGLSLYRVEPTKGWAKS
jgi:hypothetical protein